ncbi:MAG: hypothetical protein KJ880_08070 [Candidatus Omnitrophica bacterium]|nr:hypothetical protein [Candidatus Omnitrophota bacterium]MBU1869920.1 hypothetical protein [Candidatus Omnitrophota bacterium]
MKQSGFNPKARWDRHIPETDNSTPEDLNEKIDCLAYFKGGKILPQEFTWNNKTYRIQKITYAWQERLGRETINNFSVSTGPDLYQISFNNTTYGWRINKVIE